MLAAPAPIAHHTPHTALADTPPFPTLALPKHLPCCLSTLSRRFISAGPLYLALVAFTLFYFFSSLLASLFLPLAHPHPSSYQFDFC